MPTKFPSKRELDEVRKVLDQAPASRPLAKDASPVEKTKHALCAEFVKFKNENKLTQRALAERIGADEALVSKIIHYRFDEFSTDRLIDYLSKLYPQIELKVRVA